jgi:transposase
MKRVELYAQVRRAVYVEGISQREAARRFGIDPRTVAKMLAFSVPPGYRRSQPPARPKLDPFVGIIDRILEEDKSQPAKQHHTAKRIFERLRDEHGYGGGISIVRGYVHERRERLREMFVPLRHDPGHAQVDFGEAFAVIAGQKCKIHFFAMDLPHSDACLVQAYPAESTEAFCEGHKVSLEFFGGVPQSILYDNTKLAVARILGDGTRRRTRIFSELQSHYLFADRFGRPGKGNDKGKVEGLVGYARRNFMVPIPRAASCGQDARALDRDSVAIQPRRTPFDAAQHQVFDRIEADHTARDRFSDPGQDIVEAEHLQQAQDLDELTLAGLAHASLEQPAQGCELLGELPSDQWRSLVERADLAFQQGQVMQRVEHEVLVRVGTRVPGDLLAGAGDHHFVDITADQDLAMSVCGRHRIVVAAIAHQRQRADPRRLLFAGLIGSRW